jgi:hypothetical protein
MRLRASFVAMITLFSSSILCAQAVRKPPCTWSPTCFESDDKIDAELISAAFVGDVLEVRRLINDGASATAHVKNNGLTSSGESVLCLTAESSTFFKGGTPAASNYRNIVRLLLSRGADGHECSFSGIRDPDLLKLLMSHGARPDSQGNLDPIAVAMSDWINNGPRSGIDVVKILLESGADPNAKGSLGRSLLCDIPGGGGPTV